MKRTVTWRDFREQYTRLQVSTFRQKDSAESRLNIVERILNPSKLQDLCSTEVLLQLQVRLLNGEGGRLSSDGDQARSKRSPHTVKGHMKQILAALRWAEYMGMVDRSPQFRHLKTAKLRQLKGRPVTEKEFQLMLDATPGVVGKDVSDSWILTLRGLWASGLRLRELLNVHWRDERYIVPKWSAGEFPVLRIPSELQKNDTDEIIPLLPEFDELLMRTPKKSRRGWVFHPLGTTGGGQQIDRTHRLSTYRIGEIISRIGKRAGVVVVPASDGSDAKHASAHDLRRACAERLVQSGVAEREVACVMRHRNVVTTRKYYATGDVQHSASLIRGRIWGKLSDPVFLEYVRRHLSTLDLRWLELVTLDVKRAEKSGRTWSARIESIKQRYRELTLSRNAFPWCDAVVVETWGQLP